MNIIMLDTDFGSIEIHLNELIAKQKLNRTLVSYRSEIAGAQLNRLCRGETAGINFHTLAKLCWVLDCSIGDLLEYIPPKPRPAA